MRFPGWCKCGHHLVRHMEGESGETCVDCLIEQVWDGVESPFDCIHEFEQEAA